MVDEFDSITDACVTSGDLLLIRHSSGQKSVYNKSKWERYDLMTEDEEDLPKADE